MVYRTIANAYRDLSVPECLSPVSGDPSAEAAERMSQFLKNGRNRFNIHAGAQDADTPTPDADGLTSLDP